MSRRQSKWNRIASVLWVIASLNVGWLPKAAATASEAVALRIDARGNLSVDIVADDGVTLAESEQAVVVWGEGTREYWQPAIGRWCRPSRASENASHISLASASRSSDPYTTTDWEFAQATTQLSQVAIPTILRATGSLVTPYPNAVYLSAQITIRRQRSEDNGELPPGQATLFRGREELLHFELPANATRVRWADIPRLSKALRNGLPPGAYELRHQYGTGVEVVRFVIADAKQRRAVLQHADAICSVLGDPQHPLSVQVAVEQLLAAEPPYLADALDLLEMMPEERSTSYLSALKQHVIERLRDPEQAITPAHTCSDPTGDPNIDRARTLILAGRWGEAAECLASLPSEVTARTAALAELYRAVILAESGPAQEDEAHRRFRRAIELLERLAQSAPEADKPAQQGSSTTQIDLYRAHNNYAGFLSRRARDGLHNHAFHLAVGVPRPLLKALIYWIEARRHYKRALELSDTPERRNAVNVNLAQLYFLLGDIVRTLNSADQPIAELSAIERAAARVAAEQLSRITESEGTDPVLLAVAAELQAAMHYRRGELAEARKHAERSLQMYLNCGSLVGTESAHRILGLCSLAGSDPRQREEALRHFRIARQLAELLRNRYPADRIGLSKAGFFAGRAYINEQIVALLIEQGRHAEALLAAEAAKARALYDMLAFANIAFESTAALRAKDEHALADWPEGYAALEYFLGDEGAWAFVVDTKGRVAAHRLRLPSGEPIAARDLPARVQRFLNSVDRRVRETGMTLALQSQLGGKSIKYPQLWQHELNMLYQILIPEQSVETLRAARTVVIVPHHVLHYFPFAALVVETDASAEESRMPLPKYMVEEPFAIVYSPSLSVWSCLRQRENRPIDRVHLLGIVDFAGRAPRLPNVAEEIKAVRSVFAERIQTELLDGEATEGNARRLLTEPGAVLLATHGTRQPDRPLEGYLMLHGDRNGDGRLTAAEIYSTEVRADLVLLTACYGGLADQSPLPGDDLFGIQRALLHSGARAVLSGLWDVHDGIAPELVGAFCRNLAAGTTAPHAWAEAQRKFLVKWRQSGSKSGSVSQFLTHPYYWAVFTLTGDDRVCMAAAPWLKPPMKPSETEIRRE